MNENLKRHRPDIKVLGEGRAIAFMPEDPMGVWVHIQEVRDQLDVKDKEIAELREATRWRDVEKEPPEIKEDSEEVAVLVEYENNYSRGVFVTYSDFYKGVFYETHLDNDINCDYDNDGERCYQKVIKWQPMPKALEEGK